MAKKIIKLTEADIHNIVKNVAMNLLENSSINVSNEDENKERLISFLNSLSKEDLEKLWFDYSNIHKAATYSNPVTIAMMSHINEGLIRTYPIEKTIKYIKDYFGFSDKQIVPKLAENGVSHILVCIPNVENNLNLVTRAMSACGYYLGSPREEAIPRDEWVWLQYEPKNQEDASKQITECQIDKTVKNAVGNFLNEYRSGTRNNGNLVSINENNIKRMITTHSDSGYIVISPCRGGSDFGIDPNTNQHEADKLAHINKERVKEIINDIKKSGFSYTPTYGGFIENLGAENETVVYERSFIVYNKDRSGQNRNFDDLFKFGLAMCRKYNQDSFLVQAPGTNPKYVKQDGSVDFEFSGGKVFNDVSQEYFTDLHKNTNKQGDISSRKPTRFSFTEAYVNPKPQCYSERHVRWANGEVF